MINTLCLLFSIIATMLAVAKAMVADRRNPWFKPMSAPLPEKPRKQVVPRR